MLGYSAAEVINHYTPADISASQELVERAQLLSRELGTLITPGFEALVFKASRGIEDIYELSYIRKDGTRLPAIVSVTALRDAADGIIGYLLIGTDNTLRKRAEDALLKAEDALQQASALQAETVRHLNTDLEQRVKDRTEQLNAANQELEAFSYSVSHDLRAPLRTIDGYSQVVLSKFGPQLPEDGQRYLQTIRAGAQKMGELIDDLLMFARLNRQELKKRAFDTREIVSTALQELGSPWPDRKVLVRVGELAGSSGDPALLKQVWLNLLSNALKYTRNKAEAILDIGGTMSDGACTFFVRDNGTGFDMRFADKLFGVFQRLHRAEDYEGTGVGLAIAQRIVHRHGGRIWAEATVDQGATFYFTLPSAALS